MLVLLSAGIVAAAIALLVLRFATGWGGLSSIGVAVLLAVSALGLSVVAHRRSLAGDIERPS